MPVKKDASGRRSVEAEVEVPGTPEEVWQAIATGPGISSWFVPTRVEERVGGAAISDFRILRLYLTHFREQPCSPFQLMGVAPEPKSEAWAALIGSLGLAGAAA